MSKNSIIGIAVVVVVLAVGGYFLFGTAGTSNATAAINAPVASGAETATVGSQPTDTTTTQGTTGTTSGAVTVTYSDAGFSPKSVTISKGQSVTFVNQSSNPMWVASNPHPAHTGYSGTTRQQHCPDTAGTAFDQCGTGSSYTFTFQKTGSWGYHNHVSDNDSGTIIVQ